MDAALSVHHIEELKQRLAELCGRRDELPQELSRLLNDVLEELQATVDNLREARHDLGERNSQINAALHNAESERKRYHELFAFAPDGYLVTDPHGLVQEANHAANRMLAGDEARLTGISLWQFVALEQQAQFEELLQRTRSSGELCDAEMALRRPGSKCDFPAALRVAPVRDGDGSVCALRWMIRDIGDRRAAEHQISRYQGQLRALASDLTITEQRERRRLATELHDYMAQLLVVSRMKVVELDRSIRSPRAIRLTAEINGVLKEALRYTRTLISELSPTILYDSGFPAAAQWLAAQMQRHGVKIDFKPLAQPVILPDEIAIILFECLRELLMNVVRHAHTGCARVELSRDGDLLSVTVADDGVGFDTQAWSEQATAAGKYGLFSVRERLEAIGGQLAITSESGGGTTAVLNVRVQDCTEADIAEPSSVKLAIAGAEPNRRPRRGRGKAIRVLLVDDHELVREGLRSVIESQAGLHIVGEAIDGQDAITLAAELQPEVIVMDINMPRMNGIEATRRIKEEHPLIHIVALSVHDGSEVAAAMREAGACAFVSKAEASDHLCEAIRTAESLALFYNE